MTENSESKTVPSWNRGRIAAEVQQGAYPSNADRFACNAQRAKLINPAILTEGAGKASRSESPTPARWKSRALLTILLIVPLASRANAQTTPIVLAPGTTTPSPTPIITTGDVFRGMTGAAATSMPAMLTIGPGTTIATAPNGTDSALVVNGGGNGQNTPGGGNNSMPAGVIATVTGTGAAPVNLTSSGQSVVWLFGNNTGASMGAPATASMLTVIGEAGNPASVVLNGNGTPVMFHQLTSAQEATVVTVQNGASANISNATLNLGGPDGFLDASKMAVCSGGCGETGNPGTNNGGNTNLQNVVINVMPAASAGIWVSRLGTNVMTGGSITTMGADSQGVHTDASGTLTLNDVPITMNGANSLGAFANTFNAGSLQGGTATGMITINGGSITTTNVSSTGVMASGSDAGQSTMNNQTATVFLNPDANGVVPSITTMAADSNGLVACNCDTTGVGGAIIGVAHVTGLGMNSTGAFAQDTGSITLMQGSTIGMAGDNSAAYFANNGTISATGTTAVTTGMNSPGAIISNGGNLAINGGSVTTSGPGSFGFLVEPASQAPFPPTFDYPATPGVSNTNPTATNTLTIANATVSSAADAFHVTGVPADINITDSTVTGNNGVLLNTVNGGMTTLTDTASTLTGAILTDPSSTANVSLSHDVWNMTGSSNMTSLNENTSMINFAPPAPGADVTMLSSYKTLTTNTFTGNAGEINMNTFLAADSAPSDRIVITGMATATTPVSLFFHNTGGPGALTTMNGILVVQADPVGTTQPGMFVLDNPELRAGAWDYMLFRGGVNGSDPNDWFLRSTFVPVPLPPGEVAPPLVPLPPNELPPAPPVGPLPPGVAFPIIGPEIATYGVVQPIAREMGLATLGTFHERTGDPDGLGSCCCTATTTCCSANSEVKTRSGTSSGTRDTQTTVETQTTVQTQTTVTPTGNCNRPAVWARVIGVSVDNRYQSFADPQATGQLMGFQAGFDVWRGSLIAGHSDTVGIYLAYLNAGINVNGIVTNPGATAYITTHTGSVNMNGYSGGAYWTHIGPTGWYIDAVIQGTGYDGSASTQNASLPLNGFGFVTSLETGYPFPFPWLGPTFVLEPQAQIIWQEVNFSGANDGLGPVNLGTTSGWTGRLGLRGKWTFVSANGTVWQPYLQGNIWRDWGAEADTTFGIDQVPLLEQATRYEVLGGITARLNATWSVYAQAGYQFAADESGPNPYRRDSFQGSAGFKYAW